MARNRLQVAALLLCSSLALPPLATGSEVGIFLQNQPDCSLRTAAVNRSCSKDSVISDGDIITTSRSPRGLAVQWRASDYTSFPPVATGQFRVVFTPPKEQNVVLSMLGDLVGFARKAGRISHSAVTRGAFDAQPMLPGETATLLPRHTFTFSWCARGVKKIVISRENGAPVREIEVPKGARSLNSTPEELGLAAGESYRWMPAGAKDEGGRIVVLNEDKAKPLIASLALIDGGHESAAEKALKKAALVNFISENYQGYSLGWLQFGLTGGNTSELSADDRLAAEQLNAESGVSTCE